MATLQIFLGDNSHADPAQDLLMWKRGMVVNIYADGVCKEPPAPDSKMGFIHIPGVSVFQCKKYTAEVETLQQVDGKQRRQVSERRKFQLELTDLTGAQRRALQDNKEVTLTLQQAKKIIKDRQTGQREA